MPVASSPSADWLPLKMQHLASATTHKNTHYVSFLLKHTWNGLALFAIFVIVRHTTRRILVWRRDTNTSTNSSPATISSEKYTLPKHQSSAQRETPVLLSSYQPYRRPHYLFPPPAPPPFWMMDDQAEDFSAATCRDGGAFGQGSSPRPGSQVEGSALGDSGSSPRPRAEPTLQRYVMMRPPPPPPLTPPALSPSAFSRNEHRLYHRGAPELDSSFIHQPNPDYLSSTSLSISPALPASPTYAKSRPVDIPAPLQQHHSDSSGSGATEDESPSSGSHGVMFSSNSFPTTSPFLPPAPPNHEGFPLPEKGIEVQGEVISATDGYGTGWTRHTRVYGGGVCLACAASGGEGGFYGATAFRPDDRG